MKYLVVLFFIILLFSCKTDNYEDSSKGEMLKEIEFNSHSFEHLFKKSLNDLETSMEGENKTIMLEFYIDQNRNYDTIINIKNCPQICVKNLVHVKKYNNQHIYIYYTGNLEGMVSKLINIQNEPINSVNMKPVPNEFECIYKKVFILKNNKFVLSE